jgi:hypothetical protein
LIESSRQLLLRSTLRSDTNYGGALKIPARHDPTVPPPPLNLIWFHQYTFTPRFAQTKSLLGVSPLLNCFARRRYE